MRELQKSQRTFLLISLLALLLLGAMLLIYPKGQLHLLLNAYHSPALDIFFRNYTYIATWPLYAIAIALILFYRSGWAAYLVTSELMGILFVQPIKYIFNMPRPVTWFAEHMPNIYLPLVEGVKMHHWHSFPSGHTKSAFVLFFCLCIILDAILSTRKNLKHDSLSTKLIQVIAALGAILAGYSRIYLSQHFAFDVFAGGLIGLICPIITYTIYRHYQLFNQRWFDWHLI